MRRSKPLRATLNLGLFTCVVLASSCASWEPTFPLESEVARSGALPIDGTWKRKGARMRIEGGVMYSLEATADGAPVGAVRAKDIAPSDTPFVYDCRVRSIDRTREVVEFKPGRIEVDTVKQIALVTELKNAQGRVKRRWKDTYTSDDPQPPRALAEAMLLSRAKGTAIGGMRLGALAAIPDDDATMLKRVVNECPDVLTRKSALKRLTDEGALASIAIENDDERIRAEAASRVNSEAALITLATQATDSAIRQAAFDRVTSEGAMRTIAADARDASTRALAAKLLAAYQNPVQCIADGDAALERGEQRHAVTLQVSRAMKARRRTPAQQQLLRRLGNGTRNAIAAELKAYREAIRFYRIARTADPESAEAIAKLAVALACHARQANVSMFMSGGGRSASRVRGVFATIPETCLDLADDAVARSDNDPTIRGYRGWVRSVAYHARRQESLVKGQSTDSLMPQADAAIADLDAAIAAGVCLPRALVQRARCHLTKGHRTKAAADLERALDAGATSVDPDLLRALGR